MTSPRRCGKTSSMSSAITWRARSIESCLAARTRRPRASLAWERFGDPAAVARRLWLDAMKGKIMAQRLLIAACVALMLACGTSVGLVWHWMNLDQLQKSRAASEASEANRRMADALAQSQATNQEMLKQMQAMSEAIRHPSSLDWNPVIFKLTEETPDGPPAAGFYLTLTPLEGNRVGAATSGRRELGDRRMALSTTDTTERRLHIVLPGGMVAQPAAGQFGGRGGTSRGMGGGMGGMGQPMGGAGPASAHTIFRKSDASGIADFGAVQPGDYRFRIAKNWPNGSFSTVGQLNVMPGSKVQKLLVCPKVPPQRVTVRVRCAWPADLEKEHLLLYAPFVFRYRRLEPDVEWSLADTRGTLRAIRRSNLAMINQPQGFSAIRSVLCGPGTMLTEILNHKGLFLWSSGAQDKAVVPLMNAARTAPVGRFRGPGESGSGQPGAGAPLGPGDLADILMHDLREVKLSVGTVAPQELEWEPGIYGLNELIVLRPSRSANVESGRRRFDVLVASHVNGRPYPVQVRGAAPDNKEVENIYQSVTGGGYGSQWGGPGQFAGYQGVQGPSAEFQSAAPSLELRPEFWDQVDLGFEARLGQVNEWTIPLPDELVQAVRKALTTEAMPRATPLVPVTGVSQ